LALARERMAHKLADGSRTVYELQVRTRDGRLLDMEIGSQLRTRPGEPPRVEGIARDVTDRKRLEEQLRQSQKMEAVGRLAGGIAHDFNNLLTAVNGFSELLLAELPAEAPGRAYAEEIRKAGERAALLTRQLLAFGRRQMLQPKVLDVNAVVAEVEHLLRRVIGEDVRLDVQPGKDLGKVLADPGQLGQVLMNLAVNARDAMPTGGRLTITTRNVDRCECETCPDESVASCPHALLEVRDTGCGMEEEIRARLFEPFFTTKEVGKGTGLGLATVYGIVKQSGGHITVESRLGAGTVFRVYLPCVEDAPRSAASHNGTIQVAHGRETVLLVEDEGA